MSTSDRFTDDVGAYLLGALEPGEAAAFEGHLQDCATCRDDIERLTVARDALPRSVEQIAVPASLKASLMEQVRAEAAPEAAPTRPPSRPRWRELLLARPAFAAAAAAVILAVGIALGTLVGAVDGGGGGGGGGGERTLAAVVDQTRMPSGEAALELPADRKGSLLRVEGMQQPQNGKVYEVWVKRGSRVIPASLFTVDRNGTGTAAIPDDLSDADAVMVTREPKGGSSQPSEPPVVTVSVAS